MTAAGLPHIPAFTVGDRLRKAREDAGLGSMEMAEAIGVSRNTIGNVESGRVRPRKIVLNAWALVTGVPMSWLKDGIVGESPDGGASSSMVELRTFNPKTLARHIPSHRILVAA